ncbi:hypothetical protein, variant [Loa loa]|uniref:Uncharacterized protein n=1 Tax=Loa loa TaxID=7209 RepID=A0A1S0UFG0_LOALO|nr:hypothetical protein LOAG_06854 [Loa loa]XP_020305342.1 hypothetical protein, variant [Loa loa]EFO21630.1 hypothetical protein LOAG_06854 [Loa loa]EJD74420.1 hypothetical protein, variant [Loa loa]
MKSALFMLPLLIGIYNILLATSKRPPRIIHDYDSDGESYDCVYTGDRNPVLQEYEKALPIESSSWDRTTPPVIVA